MENSNQRKIGAMLSYISIIASTLVGLLYTPFLISKLGQSEYGLYSLVSSVIGYLTVLDLGFGNAIVVYTAKYREKKEFEKEKILHGMFKIIYCIIGIVASIVGVILFLNVDNMFKSTMNINELSEMKVMMLILSFNLGITFMFSIYTSIITAYEKFVFQKLMSIVNTLLKPLLMIPLLFMGYKSITMCVVITIVNIVVLFSNYLFCLKKIKIKIKYCGFDKRLFKEILGYSIWLFLGTIVDKVNWSADNFILGVICSTTAVSVYAVASQLNTLFINLSTAISGVLLPKVSKMIAQDVSSTKLSEEMIKVGRIQYYIIFLMASGLVIFGKQFIYLWVGHDYSESYYVALILIIPLCFPLIQNLGLSIMQAMNKYKFKSISTAIMAVFNIIISIILTKKYGAIGAAMGTAIALIVCNIIIINIYYSKVIKLNVLKFWYEIIIMTVKFIPSILVIMLILWKTGMSGLKEFVFYGIVYCCIFMINSYTIVMNDYEKNMVKKVYYKVFKRKRV